LSSVIEAIDAKTIYDVPMLMLKEKLDITVLEKLKLEQRNEPDLTAWKSFLGKLKNPVHEVTIGLVGKYIELADAYKSIHEAFIHAGAENECKVKIRNIHSEDLDGSSREVAEKLTGLDGVLVAPGFGERGIEGKINAIKFVRENKIPFFGICLGMQCAVVEFCRNVLKLKGASSSEVVAKPDDPVIDLMEDQKNIEQKGGTMRLGQYPCTIEDGSKANEAYKSIDIMERHRHRYEFNNAYKDQIIEAGLKTTGVNPKSGLVEIVELESHPWFVGVQFHPELKSTVENPHPLFVAFVKAALTNKQVLKSSKETVA